VEHARVDGPPGRAEPHTAALAQDRVQDRAEAARQVGVLETAAAPLAEREGKTVRRDDE